MKAPVSTAIAIAVGILILLGYFIPLGPLEEARSLLIRWAVILAAFALLVGVINLVSVHATKVKEGQPGGPYSVVLLISLAATIVLVGYFGPTGKPSLWVFNHIQLPIERSLMALLAVVLLLAGIRVLRRRTNGYAILFLVTALLVLIGSAPLFLVGEIPILSTLRAWIVQVPAAAGARGILFGVALGTIATGIRILMGADRPYSG